jgi:APA family basic amino acid/polyamine antiporter
MPERQEEVSLKREVGWLGSFAMGYADVGADVYIALGLVALYAGGASPIAFAIAAIAYVLTGLSYAELASTYPYAGGAQVYAMKGFNDFAGFLAGWMLLLSYTVDIALFSLAASGYLSYFIPSLSIGYIKIGSLKLSFLSLTAFVMVIGLIALNFLGIKESSALNVGLVLLDLTIQSLLLILGFLLAFNLGFFLAQLKQFGTPTLLDVTYLPRFSIASQNFIYGTTLAMSSFIGIESIAQAAEETKRPYKWIPVATKLSIMAVLIFVLGLSTVSIGVLGWENLSENIEDPLVALALSLPRIGGKIAPLVAFTGFTVNLVSANTGVIGVSRVVFSMGRYRLMPRWFYKVHPRFRTPIRTILIFGAVGAVMTFMRRIEQVADVYAFGALLSYVLVNASLIRLRKIDKDAFRPWKAPGNIKLGKEELPLVGVLGFTACLIMWILVVLLHPIGRSLGFLWLLAGLLTYFIYRSSVELPMFSRLGAKEVKPGAQRIDAVVFLRLPEKPDQIVRLLQEALDRRFVLHLVHVIDPRGLTSSELVEIRNEALDELRLIANHLRRRGYEVNIQVLWGELIKTSIDEASKDIYDFAVVLSSRRRVFKGQISEEAMASNMSAALPGKVIVIRRD